MRTTKTIICDKAASAAALIGARIVTVRIIKRR